MPIYLRVNDRPPSTDTMAYIWPKQWPNGLDVTLYDPGPLVPAVLGEAVFPDEGQAVTIDAAPAASVAITLGTAANPALFRTGVIEPSTGEMLAGAMIHCVEVLPTQTITLEIGDLGFDEPIRAMCATIDPPDSISILGGGAPPVSIRVLGTAAHDYGGPFNYDITFRAAPANSAVDTNRIVDLIATDITVTPGSAAGTPVATAAGHGIGALLSDAVTDAVRRQVQMALEDAAEDLFTDAVPAADLRITASQLTRISPTVMEIEAVVGAVDGCGRSLAAWDHYYNTSIVSAAGELFAADVPQAAELLEPVRSELLELVRQSGAMERVGNGRQRRMSARDLASILRLVAPQASPGLAGLLASVTMRERPR